MITLSIIDECREPNGIFEVATLSPISDGRLLYGLVGPLSCQNLCSHLKNYSGSMVVGIEVSMSTRMIYFDSFLFKCPSSVCRFIFTSRILHLIWS